LNVVRLENDFQRVRSETTLQFATLSPARGLSEEAFCKGIDFLIQILFVKGFLNAKAVY
jgi:hypothetical protein